MARGETENELPAGSGGPGDHFGVILGSLWVYDGDLKSLWDHCGIIVESLWVYEGTFSKNNYFPTHFHNLLKYGVNY